MGDKVSSRSATREVTIPDDFEPIPSVIPGAGYTLPTGTRGIFCAGTSGTIDVTLTGSRRNSFPMLQGVLMPGKFRTIHAVSAANLNLWAVL